MHLLLWPLPMWEFLRDSPSVRVWGLGLLPSALESKLLKAGYEGDYGGLSRGMLGF